MRFTDEQKQSLGAPLASDVVKTRDQAGRKLSYVEGWHVIAEANRIFGFDGWSSETTETKCVSEKERTIGRDNPRPGWGVTYNARVRIMVMGDGPPYVIREGYGSGHGIDVDLGLAHESAIKEAETDARKRALMTFGNVFGLALYDKERANVASAADIARERFVEASKMKIADFTDPTALLAWWSSDEQRKARRDFSLTADEVATLKGLVTARLPARQEQA
jgi:DNA repair and recombination protein RAD52